MFPVRHSRLPCFLRSNRQHAVQFHSGDRKGAGDTGLGAEQGPLGAQAHWKPGTQARAAADTRESATSRKALRSLPLPFSPGLPRAKGGCSSPRRLLPGLPDTGAPRSGPGTVEASSELLRQRLAGSPVPGFILSWILGPLTISATFRMPSCWKARG